MTIVAAFRPDSWNLPLFLHVFGAIALFGTTATIAIVGFASRAHSDQAPFLSRLILRIFLLGVLPAWILMRVAAQWIDGKEFPKHEPSWVGAGYIVSEGGGVFLLVAGILAWVSARRDGRGRAALAVPVIASVVLVALGVAWFFMSAKP